MAIRLYRIPFDCPGEDIPLAEIIGKKAHNLMRIAGKNAVPPGFVIPVDYCREYASMDSEALSHVKQQIKDEMEWLECLTGKQFKGKRRPLLVSVRSGAPVSMPGMMQTILNIGLNEETARGLIRQTGNPKFVWDSFRRFIQQYGEVVHGLPSLPFEKIFAGHLRENNNKITIEPDIDTLRKITAEFQQLFTNVTGTSFPRSPTEQLRSAIKAVVLSWQSKRAAAYRKIHNIPDDIGTAVIIQEMVYGNTGRSSGSGVGFTRNPANGNKEPFLDYLPNAQGEDVVSGRINVIHTESLKRDLPEVQAQLLHACSWLEKEFQDMQDFEFTVEQGKLFLLQSRSGKRTGPAALKIATDLVEEGIITPSRGLELLTGYKPEDFITTSLVPAEGEKPVASAVSAGSGVAIGIAVFDMDRVEMFCSQNKPVIYLSKTLSTDDIDVINRVCGLVTVLGARTSHAAVVARQLGKVCLVACQSLLINDDLRHCHFGEVRVEEGEWLSLDGNTGQIYLGKIRQVISSPQDLLAKVATWQ